MKKILSLVLAFVLSISIFGCAGNNKTSDAPASASAETEAKTETKKETKTTYKIGMVTDVGGVNDQSFNQLSWEGLKKFGEENKNVEVSYLESKTDADYQSNLQTFLDEDFDLIISVGYMLADATREAAIENPDKKFAIIDDASVDLPNVADLIFAQDEVSYLVGVVAGMMTKTNTIGYVQGMVSDSLNLFGIGYIEGAKSVNPDINVLQYNANSFADSAAGSTAATDMVTKGADIIYHAAGGTGAGVISACKDNKIYAIGVDSDQSRLAPDTVITSAMKRVDVSAIDISRSVLDGTYSGGVKRYSLANNGVDIAPTTTHLTQEVIDKVQEVKKDIIAGKIKIPQSASECPDFILK